MEENLGIDINSTPKEMMSFNKDVLSIVISGVVDVIFIVFGFILLNEPGIVYLILGVVLFFYGLLSFSKLFSEFGSALSYHKAEKELNGLYLRRTKPKCPYLKSSYSGFICQIEFEQSFDIQSDIPKCHLESAFRKHWEEKAPNVLNQAKQTTNKNLVAFMSLLGHVKYTEAIPFISEIVDLPVITREGIFVVENATDVPETDLRAQFIESFLKLKPSATEIEKQDAKSKLDNKFDNVIRSLSEKEIIQIENGIIAKNKNYSDPNFIAKWKFYSSPYIKQYALMSLSQFEDPSLIPKFFEIYVNSTDSKLASIAKKGLVNLKDQIEEPLLDLLHDPNLSSDKKLLLIDLAGKVESEKIFSTLTSLAGSDDETLSYYAISALGKQGEKGIEAIIQLMQQHPTDLKIDSGRSALVLVSETSFKSISNVLIEGGVFSDEFIQILSSVLEELDHEIVKKYFDSLPVDEQDKIDDAFEKYGLAHHLDYFLGN